MTFVRSPIIVMFDACSNLLIKTPEQRQSRRSGVFTVNVEHISLDILVLTMLLRTKCHFSSHLCRNQSADLHCIQLTGFNILF